MTNGSVRVSVFGKTDLGRTREHNEDTFLVADLSTGKASLQPEVRNHAIGPRGSLFMVADGMGGHPYGAVAASRAVYGASSYLLEKLDKEGACPERILHDAIPLGRSY